MDCKKIYDMIIRAASTREKLVNVYTEKHHIIPKSMGGNNSNENLVVLTAREHFLCHLLLAKIYGGKMIYAAHMMANIGRYTNRKYEYLRIEHAKRISLLLSGKKKPDGFGKIISENKRRADNISKAMTGRVRSEDHSKHISDALTGRELSIEHKRNISVSVTGEKNGMFRKTHTEESRKLISDANKQTVKCPHCNKEGGIAIMKRWHFGNCKRKK